jgi:hypothetical protein
MPLDNPKGGFSYSPEYQSSALPWVTSSAAAPASGNPIQYSFNYITRFVSVTNLSTGSSTMSVGFTANGMASNNKVIVPAGQHALWEWRCTSVFVQGESGTPPYSLAVGLTTIPAGQMPALTGSFPDGTNWAGVG